MQRPWDGRVYSESRGPRENQCVRKKNGKEEGIRDEQAPFVPPSGF